MAGRCWVQPVGQPACPSVTQPERVSYCRLVRWLVITVLCICPGAQQPLRETWSAQQSPDEFAVGANQPLIKKIWLHLEVKLRENYSTCGTCH